MMQMLFCERKWVGSFKESHILASLVMEIKFVFQLKWAAGMLFHMAGFEVSFVSPQGSFLDFLYA